MGRVVRHAAFLGAALLLLLPSPARAASSGGGFSAKGSVTGSVKAGSTVTVDLAIHHPSGWQRVQHVVVALQLKGVSLDRLVFEPADFSISIVGDGAPVVVGQEGTLAGTFLRVNTARLSLKASGKDLGLTIPLQFATAPPEGARLFFAVNALGVVSSGFHPLTPPVKATKGFSWGTLGLAIAVALFAGGFAGNLVASNRRRPKGPSIYGTVAKRLEEERARR